jgi:hypothetical protein
MGRKRVKPMTLEEVKASKKKIGISNEELGNLLKKAGDNLTEASRLYRKAHSKKSRKRGRGRPPDGPWLRHMFERARFRTRVLISGYRRDSRLRTFARPPADAKPRRKADQRKPRGDEMEKFRFSALRQIRAWFARETDLLGNLCTSRPE